MPPLKFIGKYEIVDAIGSGGMGTVYRAFDPTLERIVAVKLLHLDTHEVSPAELSERFRNEARAVARLNHPAIVAIFDYDDRDPAGPYIAMEYVNGCALDEYVQQRAVPHLEDAVSAMLQVLAGLEYAHRHDVVHRDIKPSNLLITRDGMVKITDFGISKIGPRSQKQTGLLVGTPQYMAPEQYTGGHIDRGCDIHAAGVVLYELLTGEAPFTGSAAEIMHKVCYAMPVAVSAVNPQIPAAFDAVVARALEKQPENRYASTAEFAEALRSIWTLISKYPASATLSQQARELTMTIRRAPVSARPANPVHAPESIPVARTVLQAPVSPPPSSAPSSPPSSTLSSARSSTSSSTLSSGPSSAPSSPPNSMRPQSNTGAGTLASWSREQLAEIERQLTQIVGPLAKVLVRSAASNTANRQQLYAMLADHLRTPEERRRFLAGEAATGATGPQSAPAPNIAATPSGIPDGPPLTPEMLQRATQLLTRYLGPIASVLTKKAAKTAVDESHLYSLLAGKLSDPVEQQRFMRDAERPP